MGCAQSKIDNEEAVARSKDRRNLMKDAVSARNAFASGHSGYSFALKNVGAALSDFAHGESVDNQQHLEQPLDPTPPPPPPLSSLDTLPPPPPPLPNFSPSPIKRAVSLPVISKNKKQTLDFDNVAITEDEEEEEDEEDENENDDIEEEEEEEVEAEEDESITQKNKNKNKFRGSHGDIASASTSSPSTAEMRPTPTAAWEYFFMVDDHLAGPSLNHAEEEDLHVENVNANDNVVSNKTTINSNIKKNISIDSNKNVDDFMKNDGDINVSVPEKVEGKVVIEHASTAPAEFVSKRAIATVSLMKVLNQIDDHFLKASQSAKDVSNMLEANRLHYHSNFADNRGNFSISVSCFIDLFLFFFSDALFTEFCSKSCCRM